MRIAIVHDWLVTWAGAEKALAELLDLYPQADLYTIVDFLPAEQRSILNRHRIHTSFIQQLPGARKHYRSYLPLMPLAIEQFDLSNYDLVISSSHAVAKGVLTGPDTLHVCYCYTPMRYAWDLQHEYLKHSGYGRVKSAITRYLLHRLRLWDLASSQRVDHYIAISHYIARRINKCYRRQATVIYPPVDTASLQHSASEPVARSGFLTASRLVPYKRTQLILEAFAQMPEQQLTIIGDGPERPRIERQIKTLHDKGQHNIHYLGYQDDDVLHHHLATAQAFIHAAEEDFGILPIEAMASGTPVIGYGRGGLAETVIPGKTGLLFHQPTPEAIIQAVQQHQQHQWSASQCREHAQNYRRELFRTNITQQLDHWLAESPSRLL